MFSLLPAWIIIFIGFTFIGAGFTAVIIHGFRKTTAIPLDLFKMFWIGYAVVVAFLQLYSLLFPVNSKTLAILTLVSLAAAVYSRKLLKLSLIDILSKIKNLKLLFWLITSGMVIIIGLFSTLPTTNSDTNLYHLNAVKWASEYSIVPGLSNLHGRLGFNSSFLLFGALTNNLNFKDKIVYLCNSTLIFVLVIEWIVAVISQFNPNKFFVILTAPFIVTIIISGHLSSLSTDIPAYIFTLLVVKYSIDIDMYSDKLSDIDAPNIFSLLAVVVTSSLLFTTKLSGAPMSMVGIFVVICYSRNNKWLLSTLLVLPLILLLGFFIRNIVLTGWIVYPFPMGNLHLDWSISEKQALHEYIVTKSWAKMPGKEWRLVMTNDFMFWFIPWAKRLAADNLMTLIVFVSSLTILIINVKNYIRTSLRCHHKFLYISLAILLCLVYWFLTAPDVRFGAPYFWAFFAIVCCHFMANIYPKSMSNSKKQFISLAPYLIACVFIFIGLPRDLSKKLSFVQWSSLTPSMSEPLHIVRIKNGDYPNLEIYKPLNGSFCGNSPLPCSPYVSQNSKLALRSPGDLQKGFKHTVTGDEDAFR